MKTMRAMKGQRMLIGVLIVGLLLALAVGFHGTLRVTQAQGPVSEGDATAGDQAGAAVGAVIPIQGRLTDASGSPLNGDYSITASIYDTSTGGVALCSETDTKTVTNGLFNMNLSGCSVLDISGDQLYLGIKVGTDDEMIPRQAIYPVPYAWSLRPGAMIAGNVANNPALRVQNSSTSNNSSGVHALASGTTGTTYGVYGASNSADGYGGYFVSSTWTGSGVGLYARGAGDDSPDLVLGANSASADNGCIHSSPAQTSSDILLVSNDDVQFHLDENDDEDGAFRIYSGANNQILGAYETGLVRLGINGYTQSISVGDRYRDNAIIAWAKLDANGNMIKVFGVDWVSKDGTGNYLIGLQAQAASYAHLIPIAIAEIDSDSVPNNAASLRIVSVDQTSDHTFRVYINNGNGTLVDNEFVFMVTGR
jgi:hypothetical protein